MSLKKNPKNQAAASLIEYAIILGVVSAVLMGMSTYVKRGFQGRLKEMTDYFISDKQVAEVNPTATTSSSTDRTQGATGTTEAFIGGGTSASLLEEASISATSRSEDQTVPPSPNPLIPTDEIASIAQEQQQAAEKAAALARSGF